MLLTKDQQKHITKILNSVAESIRREQEKDKSKTVEGTERLIRMGRQAAYEKCYHIAKTAAEESYEAEYNGADQKIEDICKQLEGQALFLENFDTDVSHLQIKEDLRDQSQLTKKFVRDIRLLLHLSNNSEK